MSSHIAGAKTVLDVGSGTGKFGKMIADHLGIQVSGVDVINYSDAEIPFHVYAGKNLPFEDASFDVVLAVFVLHHCADQEHIFSELIRVARNKVVLFEDSFEYDWQRCFVRWNDFQSNILQGNIRVFKGWTKSSIRGMPMPYTFRSIPGWIDFFKKFPVKVSSMTKNYACFKTLTRVVFSLQKDIP